MDANKITIFIAGIIEKTNRNIRFPTVTYPLSTFKLRVEVTNTIKHITK